VVAQTLGGAEMEDGKNTHQLNTTAGLEGDLPYGHGLNSKQKAILWWYAGSSRSGGGKFRVL